MVHSAHSAQAEPSGVHLNMIGSPPIGSSPEAATDANAHHQAAHTHPALPKSAAAAACGADDEDPSDLAQSSLTVDDPHNLHERFIQTHEEYFDDALAEINAGQKLSCWSWFILPVPPFIVDGVERGSSTNRHYALRTDEQAIAYLKLEAGGINLRRNYLAMLNAIEAQLERGANFRRLMGPLDDPKARSSFKLFERISLEMGDTELNDACKRVMDRLDAMDDPPSPAFAI